MYGAHFYFTYMIFSLVIKKLSNRHGAWKHHEKENIGIYTKKKMHPLSVDILLFHYLVYVHNFSILSYMELIKT